MSGGYKNILQWNEENNKKKLSVIKLFNLEKNIRILF